MLLAVSNPINLDAYTLPAVNVGDEISAALEAPRGLRQSGQIEVSLMPGQSGLPDVLSAELKRAGYRIYDGASSLNNIIQVLSHDGGVHILHVLAHGTYRPRDQQTALLLEDPLGRASRATDDMIVTLLKAAGSLPYLVFLAACESARRDAQGRNPFVGLAPKLVQVGVPAVVAMQDLVSTVTARQVSRDFFHYLLEHGVVDKAMNQARLMLYEAGRPDWAVPVLCMRLRNGQLFTRGPRA